MNRKKFNSIPNFILESLKICLNLEENRGWMSLQDTNFLNFKKVIKKY